jgi:hypothetical protein
MRCTDSLGTVVLVVAHKALANTPSYKVLAAGDGRAEVVQIDTVRWQGRAKWAAAPAAANASRGQLRLLQCRNAKTQRLRADGSKDTQTSSDEESEAEVGEEEQRRATTSSVTEQQRQCPRSAPGLWGRVFAFRARIRALEAPHQVAAQLAPLTPTALG